MAHVLTLMSGKGGSGKTTLGLSLTKLLLECDLKVLLIDCDLATNGATYFFETKYEQPILTVGDILINNLNLPLLEVERGFFFLPTNIHFPYEKSKKNLFNYELLNRYILSEKHKYDVIICDCQAGYSRILENVLGISDMNLIVMEPDAISSSSIRILYAQVSKYLESSKTYQIFNKITKEEYHIYDKVFAGTLFTSLPSILFDWDIRKAFAYSQVPELVTTNVDFGKSVYNVATIIFPNLKEKLSVYKEMVLLFEQEKLEGEINHLRGFIKEYKGANRVKRIRRMVEPAIIMLLPIYFASILIVFFEHEYYLWDRYSVLILLVVAMFILVFLLVYVRYKSVRRDEFYALETKERELVLLENKHREIKTQLSK